MKRNIVKAFWPTLRQHKLSFLVTLMAMIIAVILHAISPYYLRGIVQEFTSEAPNVAYAKKLFWGMVIIMVGINIAYRLFDFALTLHESAAMKDIDNRNLANIQCQSASFFEEKYSGSLITQSRRMRNSYEEIADLFFFHFAQNTIMFFAIAVAFLFALPELALPFIGWTIVFIVYCFGTTWWKYPYDEISAKKDSAVGAALADCLTNNLAIKTYGHEKAEEAMFAKTVQDSHQARLASWMRSNLIMVGQWIIMVSGELAFVWWMITGWEKGLVTAADFVFAQTFIVWAIAHLMSFGHNLRRLFSAIANAEEMADIYCSPPEVSDAAGARSLIIERGSIEFHAINFHYCEKTEPKLSAVKDFSLKIPDGKSIGLVGKSGAGKSTLVKLLLRLYDLDSGYIRIDQQDIANVTQASLRQQCASVPQPPQLFHRSVKDNIRFATVDATEDDIILAAKQACAWSFIKQLPQGLDTMVGERGIKLSGGEQQRIVLARAILADPKILILDEATSSLDSETEKQIQLAIAHLLKGRTAIVIAHRLSTIMQLDEIVVMENGAIVETGSHTQLLDKAGVYAELWAHQSGSYLT